MDGVFTLISWLNSIRWAAPMDNKATKPVLKNIHVHVDVNKLLHFVCLLAEPPKSGPFTLIKSDLLMHPKRGLV